VAKLNLTRRDIIRGVSITVGLTNAGACDDIVRTAPEVAADPVLVEYFLNFSEQATGFSLDDLESTDQATVYFATVRDALGVDRLGEFLHAYHNDGLDAVLGSPKAGPIARNVIKLWYTAMWERLPREWQSAYGRTLNDTTFIVSAAAYKTGLLWRAIGVNPPGANAPGYGTWSNPPART
jgi:hypothetical protein